jgi:hypothetical protein
MAESAPLKLELKALLGWVLPVVVIVAGVGVLPTWLTTGWAGVLSELLAVGVVLGVLLVTGWLTVYAARLGTNQAATVFLGCSIFRLLLCPALVALGWMLTALPHKPMGVWLVVSYLLVLGLEVIWLVRALRQSARQNPNPDDTETDEH